MARIAVVGAGPAGLYAAQALLRARSGALAGLGMAVDVIDRLPTPFGLVRTGVAPDHANTKKAEGTLGTFAASAVASGALRFFGNVRVGEGRRAEADSAAHVSLDALRDAYDAVVLAAGAEGDNKLHGVPGDNLPRVLPARAAAWWYNGHPDAALDHHAMLARAVAGECGGDTAVVVGAGNVALDLGESVSASHPSYARARRAPRAACERAALTPPCTCTPTNAHPAKARLLLCPPELLHGTDCAPAALAALKASKLRKVTLLVRRGPAAAAFTPKELREVLGMDGIRVSIDGAQTADTLLTDGDREAMVTLRPRRRVYDLLCKAAEAAGDSSAARELEMRFFTSPSAFVAGADRSDGGVARVECQARGETGVTDAIDDVALVLTSIGQRGVPMEGAPFDHERGVVPNDGMGRVVAAPGSTDAVPGLYVVGWLKRGANGIVGTNLVCAGNTVACIEDDIARGTLVPKGSATDPADVIRSAAEASSTRSVSWAGWEAIDAEERRLGEADGRPRHKLTDVKHLLSAAAAS